MAMLYIMRQKGLVGFLRSFDVTINGMAYAKLRNGASIQVPVQPGRYVVRFNFGREFAEVMVEASEAAPVTAVGRTKRVNFWYFLAPLIWLIVNRAKLIEAFAHAPAHAGHFQHQHYPPQPAHQHVDHGQPAYPPHGYHQPAHQPRAY
jgi:hypothetical protein